MDARGYVYDEGSPDLRVNFQGIVQEKTNVYSVPRTDYQVFYSYRHRSYFAVPFWYDETQVNRYTEGTLTVDLVDAAQNRLVWTGAAIGRVTRKDPQERAMEVDRARSEESRVGKESVSTCRSRWSTDHKNNNNKLNTTK